MVIKLLTDAAPFPSRAPEYTQLNEKKKCISFIPSLRGLFSPSSREANWEAKMILLVTKWINKSATRVRSSINRYALLLQYPVVWGPSPARVVTPGCTLYPTVPDVVIFVLLVPSLTPIEPFTLVTRVVGNKIQNHSQI